jgi:hypothetical protein
MKQLLAYALTTIMWLLDILVPRMITEKMALVRSDEPDEYEVLCPFEELEHLEAYDATWTMHYFNLFGFAVFPKVVGEIDTKGGVCIAP